jgi:hypothetical protein
VGGGAAGEGSGRESGEGREAAAIYVGGSCGGGLTPARNVNGRTGENGIDIRGCGRGKCRGGVVKAAAGWRDPMIAAVSFKYSKLRTSHGCII